MRICGFEIYNLNCLKTISIIYNFNYTVVNSKVYAYSQHIIQVILTYEMNSEICKSGNNPLPYSKNYDL